MQIYYRVFRPGNHPPTVKHSTYHDAQREANRLATLHPTQIFEILACVSLTSAQAPTANTYFMDGVIAEI